jgi:hypothetical protein
MTIFVTRSNKLTANDVQLIAELTVSSSIWVVKATEQVSGDYDVVFLMAFNTRNNAKAVYDYGRLKVPRLYWQYDAIPFLDNNDYAIYNIDELSEGFYNGKSDTGDKA